MSAQHAGINQSVDPPVETTEDDVERERDVLAELTEEGSHA